MRSRLFATLALGACALLSAGCATTNQHDLFAAEDKNFGQAIEQTFAMQVIDPDPQYEGPLEGRGIQAASAIDRLNKGTVKKPDRISTSSIGTNTGGSGAN